MKVNHLLVAIVALSSLETVKATAQDTPTVKPSNVATRGSSLLAMESAIVPPDHIEFEAQSVENPPGSRVILLKFERDKNSGLGLEFSQDMTAAPNGAVPKEGFRDFRQKTFVGVNGANQFAWQLPEEFSEEEARAVAQDAENRAMLMSELRDGALITFANVKHRDGWTYHLVARVKREPGAPHPPAPPGADYTVERPVNVPSDRIVLLKMRVAANDGKPQDIEQPVIFKTSNDRMTGFLLRLHAYEGGVHASRVLLDLVDAETGVVYHRFEHGFGTDIRFRDLDKSSIQIKLDDSGRISTLPLLNAARKVSQDAATSEQWQLIAEVGVVGRNDEIAPQFQLADLQTSSPVTGVRTDKELLDAAPPVVVKTFPVAGAVDVDPGIQEITVTFSKAMLDGSWSWSTWGEDTMPTTIGNPKYMSDGRTCVLSVKLEPGKAYAMWLNSEQFTNFKGLSGRSAVPYLLTFRTAERFQSTSRATSTKDRKSESANGQHLSFRTQPELAMKNVSASPKFDERVFVFVSEPISSEILEHNIDSETIVLSVGAKDGVRIGHAFNICISQSNEHIGVAKVMELEKHRCIAKVMSVRAEKPSQSLKGLTAICTLPKRIAGKIAVEIAYGKKVWQTESWENKIIRGLLESGGDEIQVLIKHESNEKD